MFCQLSAKLSHKYSQIVTYMCNENQVSDSADRLTKYLLFTGEDTNG